MILRGILCIVFMYLLFYMTGFLFSQITKEELPKSNIVYGSVLIISAFEIICFPFLVIKHYFHVLYGIFLAVIIILVGSFFYVWFKKKGWKRFSMTLVKGFSERFFLVLFLGAVLLQIYTVSYKHFDCYDDGYYTAVSNMALEQDRVELNDKVVYNGNEILQDFNSRPGINCWEFLIAFFAELFALHPAVLAHTFLPMLLIPVCYMAVDQVMRKMTDNTRDRFWCLFIYSLLVMLYGKGLLLSSYLVVGTWIGKALLFHLIIPLLLSECIDIVEEKQTDVTWIKIGTIAIAGVGTTATGIYTVPIYLLSIAIPYILYLLYKHRIKTIITLLKNAICSLVPLILIGIYAVAEMVHFGRNETITGQGFDIGKLYTNIFIEDRLYMVLFIISIIIVLFGEKSVRKKVLFIGQTVILFLLLLNPVNAQFIAKYITGISVYWRMFLLLPVSFLIPLGGTYILRFIRSKKGWLNHIITGIVSGISVMLFVLSGKGMFSVFSEHQNMYMIPNEILDICESFDLSSKEMITVLAEEPMNRFFRQYSSCFDVVVGRSTQVSRNEKEEKYKAVCYDIYEEGKIDEITNEYLKELGVEYIVSGESLENSEWILCKKAGGYFIYGANGLKRDFIM